MNHSKPLSRLAHAAALSAGLGALLFSLAMALHFDRTVGYLNRNAFSTLLYIVLALFALVCIAAVMDLRKCNKNNTQTTIPDLAADGRISHWCSLVAAVALIGALAWECIASRSADSSSLLRALCALAAAVYFGTRAKKRFAAFGLGVHGYCVFSVASEYFDWTVPMNSPFKIMQSAALVSVMLFMLAELSIRADRAISPARLGVTAALATVFGITNGITMIIAAIVGDIAPTAYIVRALPSLAIGAYALACLYSIANAPALSLDPLVETAPADAEQVQEDPDEGQAQDPVSPQSEIQESPTTDREEQ